MQQKRRFRSRPGQRNSVRYTFHSYGTHFSFDPHRLIEDDRVPNEANWFDKTKMLDFYIREVRGANLPHVYIRDNTGKILEV